MAGEYPQREKYFAHRFCRLLAKACVAQQIGPEACWLLTVIVQTEDAKRYTGPVFYWNEQLMAVCGFGGKHRLLTAREKAIGAGWLHYEAGTRGIAARYWVIIPAEFQGLPDSPIDENPEEYRAESARNGQSIPCQNGTANERNPDGKPDTFIPSPSPSPIKPPNPLSGGTKPGDKSPGRKIRKRDMESSDRLDAWILKNIPPPHSQDLQLKIFACAIHALKNHRRSPTRMFLAMLDKGLAGEWTVPDAAIQEASRVLGRRKAERRGTTPQHIGDILKGKNGTA